MKTMAVTMLALAALAAGVYAPSSSAGGSSLRPCGSVPIGASYNVTATPGTACRKARRIIKKAIGGKHRALGFQCHSGRDGQYGFAIKCHRGNQRVIGSSGV